MSYSMEKKLENITTNDNIIIVNLRSDTFTKPCHAMKQAMFDAEVGDDVVGEDPTINELEKVGADLLGKEAAIFVSSGTMGNLISIMNHCDVRGSEIYVGEESHIVLHEQGGASQIAGVTVYTLPNNYDGTFDLKKLETKIRESHDIHCPIPQMIAVENTINGKILPQHWIDEVVEFAKKYNLKLHMDGARLWNAVIASNIPVKKIVAGFDSISFCLSKGLGAPVGALLCGNKEFIDKARRCRKVLGGGMRQVGVLGAPGLIALENRFKLHIDHENAIKIMNAINNIKSKLFWVDPMTVQTNMVFVQVKSSSIVNEHSFANRLSVVLDKDEDDKIIVQTYVIHGGQVRLVLHLDITDKMVNFAIRKILYVIRKMDPAFNNL